MAGKLGQSQKRPGVKSVYPFGTVFFPSRLEPSYPEGLLNWNIIRKRDSGQQIVFFVIRSSYKRWPKGLSGCVLSPFDISDDFV